MLARTFCWTAGLLRSVWTVPDVRLEGCTCFSELPDDWVEHTVNLVLEHMLHMLASAPSPLPATATVNVSREPLPAVRHIPYSMGSITNLQSSTKLLALLQMEPDAPSSLTSRHDGGDE